MGKQIVTIRAVWNHTVVVEADTRQEAEEKAFEAEWSLTEDKELLTADIVEVQAIKVTA